LTLTLLFYHGSILVYPDKTYTQSCNEVKAIIQDATYPILTENAGVVIDAGKEPYYDPFVFYNLDKLGYWDGIRVFEDFKEGKIEYVVTSSLLPEEKVQRMDEDIQMAVIYYCYLVYHAKGQGYELAVYKRL
jgi:hypothetical protein